MFFCQNFNFSSLEIKKIVLGFFLAEAPEQDKHAFMNELTDGAFPSNAEFDKVKKKMTNNFFSFIKMFISSADFQCFAKTNVCDSW